MFQTFLFTKANIKFHLIQRTTSTAAATTATAAATTATAATFVTTEIPLNRG